MQNISPSFDEFQFYRPHIHASSAKSHLSFNDMSRMSVMTRHTFRDRQRIPPFATISTNRGWCFVSALGRFLEKPLAAACLTSFFVAGRIWMHWLQRSLSVGFCGL